MPSDMFEQLIQISRKALAEDHYGVAYYALAAACHHAYDEENAQRLLLVKRLACEYLEWIDECAPDYEHSSQSSADRASARRSHKSINADNINIFEALAKQAGEKAAMLELNL